MTVDACTDASQPTGTLEAMPEVLIRGTALEKKFDDFVAVDKIDFEVFEGESFGFLGPNGAGKTSTMPDDRSGQPITSGSLSVLGLDPATDGPRLRSRLGVVPQENNLDEELTVHDNLLMYGQLLRPRSLHVLQASASMSCSGLRPARRQEATPRSRPSRGA